MTNRAKEIVKFLTFICGDEKLQIFNTRNIVGDRMVTIYNSHGITIDYCPFWRYFEIFGLTETEYNYINKKCGWRR